jgi:hypothetical protein
METNSFDGSKGKQFSTKILVQIFGKQSTSLGMERNRRNSWF